MTREKNAGTKLLRLGKILRIFMEKEKVSSSWLSTQFQTTPRTIQRDIQLLKEAGFALHELQKGSYQMSKDLALFLVTALASVLVADNIFFG